jgi:hypothetical protein
MKKLLVLVLLSIVMAGCTVGNKQTTDGSSSVKSSPPVVETSPVPEVTDSTKWITYSNKNYSFSFQYPEIYQAKVNENLTTADYLYLDIWMPDKARIAEIRVYKGDNKNLSPQTRTYQQKNALGNATGSISYHEDPGGSFREYVVTKNGYIYIVYWYDEEEISTTEAKFAKSFVFNK